MPRNKSRTQERSEHNRAKLTYKQVLKVRELLATKEYSYAQMAERYRVSESAIKKIYRRETWNF
jgi:predicted DNA-binding protein YlxM (UPF0122 family)